MDIVHHALIGGAGYLIAAEHGHDLAGMGFAMGSVFPDLDVAFMAFGKRFYLRHHQGITHSLVLSPLFALLAAGPLMVLAGFQWELYLGAIVGLWLHVGLDLTNTFRIALLAPVSWRRFSLDAVFFVDSVALMLTGIFYLGYLRLGWTGLETYYPLAFALYVAAKAMLRRRVLRRLRCDELIPSALNPFGFYVLDRREDELLTYYYNAASGKASRRERHPLATPAVTAMAQTSPVYTELRRILRALEVTSVEETPERVTIEARDLAVRNFGGKFGKTRLAFDARSGALLSESANI